MERNNFEIEGPRQFGQEIEFFLQTNDKNTSTCSVHIHSAAEFLYVKEGSYTVSLNDTRYEIGEGDLILFCSGVIHHVMTGESTKNSYYVIKMPPSFFIDFAGYDAGAEYALRFALDRRENKCLWRKAELQGSDIKHALEELISEFETAGYAYQLSLDLKVMSLFLTVLRADAPSTPGANDQTTRLIYAVLNHVQQRFSEDIDEQDLAKQYGMSYSYFSRSFKRITGMTFKNYLNRTRINQAEQLILLNKCSVSEAAIACGYNSISYFIKVYRAHTGTTPYKALKTADGGAF